MNPLTPVAIRIGAIPWLPRYLRQITALDKLIQRLTRGRLSLLVLAGLPNLMLTVLGRKSGLARSTPLLCVPYGEGTLIAGSNFGGARMPAWVGNVRAAQQRGRTVEVGQRGVVRPATARELTDPAERAAAWEQMLRTWPNYAKYEQRTDRRIPVFLLEFVA